MNDVFEAEITKWFHPEQPFTPAISPGRGGTAAFPLLPATCSSDYSRVAGVAELRQSRSRE